MGTLFDKVPASAIRYYVTGMDRSQLELIAVNLLCAVAQGTVVCSMFGYEQEEDWFRARRTSLHNSVEAPYWTCLRQTYTELFGIEGGPPPLNLINFNDLPEEDK